METKEFQEFIRRFQSAGLDELEQLLDKVDDLTDEQQTQFRTLLGTRAGDALARAKDAVAHVKLILKIAPITDYVSVAYLSKRFFGKSRSWLHNRLRGNKNNGKPDTLSDDEINTLQKALFTISDEIKTAALHLS
ncbi:MAG: DUF5053 domain-containing protein [Tannerella sp.]|jgi:5,10-methylenetetrahydrofolate reductase|nr:DUF5053 domain-containing protein [Tannerella sp.]